MCIENILIHILQIFAMTKTDALLIYKYHQKRINCTFRARTLSISTPSKSFPFLPGQMPTFHGECVCGGRNEWIKSNSKIVFSQRTSAAPYTIYYILYIQQRGWCVTHLEANKMWFKIASVYRLVSCLLATIYCFYSVRPAQWYWSM